MFLTKNHFGKMGDFRDEHRVKQLVDCFGTN